jgi:hypothetical protein
MQYIHSLTPYFTGKKDIKNMAAHSSRCNLYIVLV